MNNQNKIQKVKFLRKLYTIESELHDYYNSINSVNYNVIKSVISNIFDKHDVYEYDVNLIYDKVSYTIIIKTEHNLGIKTTILNNDIVIYE